MSRDFRPGDWECECGTHNFARRDTCFKCEAGRSDSVVRSSGGRARSRSPQRAPQRGGGGGGDWREGDWECYSCQGMNFARRTECFKCQEPKDEAAGGGGYNQGYGGGYGRDQGGYGRDQGGYGRDQGGYGRDQGYDRGYGGGGGYDRGYDDRGYAGAQSYGGGRGGGGERDFREGDWECPCGGHNFARRTECFKCEAPKAGGGGAGGGYERPIHRGNDNGPDIRDGDWECTCGCNNFAKRTECFKCEKPRD